jgi:hypothetical protein
MNDLIRLVDVYPNKPWDWHQMSLNPNLTIDFITRYKKDWNMAFLSMNSAFSIETMKQTPYLEWDWRCVSSNPNITWKTVEMYPDIPWDHTLLIRNDAISWNYIQTRLFEGIQPSDWAWISSRCDVTIDDVLSTPEYPWSHMFLTINPNMTKRVIENHPEIQWDWTFMSYRETFEWALVRKYPYKEWNWNGISRNVEWDIVRDYPEYPWDWYMLSMNPKITWQTISQNIDKPWDWRAVSLNPNLTFEIVHSNPCMKWDWTYLSENHFKKSRELRQRSARTLQRMFRARTLRRYLSRASNHSKLMDEIRFKPGIGIEFFKVKEYFENGIFDDIKSI